MDGSFENEVPPPAVDGTGLAIPSSGLDVLFNKKGEDDPKELPTEEELTEWKKLVFLPVESFPLMMGFSIQTFSVGKFHFTLFRSCPGHAMLSLPTP